MAASDTKTMGGKTHKAVGFWIQRLSLGFVSSRVGTFILGGAIIPIQSKRLTFSSSRIRDDYGLGYKQFG